MFLKSRMLTDKQQSVLRKALLLYISSSYRRHHQGQISKQVLADTLAEVDGLSDLLHLKHVSE
ncbi:MAG: hypothetical protein CM15mV17_0340 [Caudoviricetes sp.]|jgi:hypothetical protein|nr:MAG: hypothetical protein CM15mV17_0340 [Caudoviricetes sp.]